VSPPERLVTRPFVFVTLAHLLQGLGYASMLLVPLLLHHLEATRSEIGAIMGTAAVGGLLFRPAVGWALDRIGRKPTIVVGTLFAACGMGLIGLVDTIGPLVYSARFVIGIGAGAMFTAYFTLASDVVPASRRTEGIALFGISGLLPLMVNPVAAVLGVKGGDVASFIPMVAMVMLTSLFFLAMVPEPPRAPRVTAGGLRGVLGALTHRSLRPVWVATIAFASLVCVFFVFATVTAQSMGVEMPSRIWFGYALAAAAVRLFGAKLPDRVGTHNIVAPSIGLYILAAFVVAGAEGEASFHLAAVLAGMAHGYTFPVLVSQVVSRVADDSRGAGLAFYTGLWDVCFLLMAPMTGVYADAFGDRALFGTVATMGIGLLVVWAILEHLWGPVRTGGGTKVEANPR
jgi:MFS family permease